MKARAGHRKVSVRYSRGMKLSIFPCFFLICSVGLFGFQKMSDEQLQLLAEKAQEGDESAQETISQYLDASREFYDSLSDRSPKELLELLNNGHPEAGFELSSRHLKTALELLERSKKDPEALALLGRLNLVGIDGPPNTEYALELLKEATVLRSPSAPNTLASFYKNQGEMVESAKWAHLGFFYTQDFTYMNAYDLTEDELLESNELAVKWAEENWGLIYDNIEE